MDAMMNRWKDKLTAIQDKEKNPMSSSSLSGFPPRPQISHDHEAVNMKKSVEKTNKSQHSHEKSQTQIPSSKRLTTPSKPKIKSTFKDHRNLTIEKSCDDIVELFAKISSSEKVFIGKLRSILEDLWNKSADFAKVEVSPRNMLLPNEMETSLMKQSHVSSSSASKRQERLYQDLERKYFDCEKEKHHLKSKVDEIVKKYENVEREMERYAKMEMLINTCVKREEEARDEVKRLKEELKVATLREVEQQRVFQQEIGIVRELVDQIRNSLPST